jgi:hypothetical protein
MIAHPAFKRHACAGVRIGERALQSSGIERLVRDAKHVKKYNLSAGAAV